MSNETEDHGRAAEVAFGPLKRALREHRYPVSVGELVEQYGGFELETATGGERLEATLERCDQTQFQEPREVRDAVLDALGEATESEATAGEREAEDGNGGATDWSRLST